MGRPNGITATATKPVRSPPSGVSANIADIEGGLPVAMEVFAAVEKGIAVPLLEATYRKGAMGRPTITETTATDTEAMPTAVTFKNDAETILSSGAEAAFACQGGTLAPNTIRGTRRIRTALPSVPSVPSQETTNTATKPTIVAVATTTCQALETVQDAVNAPVAHTGKAFPSPAVTKHAVGLENVVPLCRTETEVLEKVSAKTAVFQKGAKNAVLGLVSVKDVHETAIGQATATSGDTIYVQISMTEEVNKRK